MPFRPRCAALYALLPLFARASLALTPTEQTQAQTVAPQNVPSSSPFAQPFAQPRFPNAIASFGVIAIDEKRALDWGNFIDSVRLKKRIASLDGSLTYRAGELGFYRVSFETIGDRAQGSVRVTIVGLSGERTTLAQSESVQRWRDSVFLGAPPQNSISGADVPLPPPSDYARGFGINWMPRPAAPSAAAPAKTGFNASLFAALTSGKQTFCAQNPDPKHEDNPKIDPAPKQQPRREDNPKIDRSPEPAPRREEKPKTKRAPNPEPQRAPEPQKSPDPDPPINRAPQPQRAPEPSSLPPRAPDPAPPIRARPNVEPPRPQASPNPNPRPRQSAPNPQPDSGGNSAPNPDPPVARIGSAPDPQPDRRADFNGRYPNYARPNYRPRYGDWGDRYDGYLGHQWNFNYSPRTYNYSRDYYDAPYPPARDSLPSSRVMGASQALEFAITDARAAAEADFERQLHGE